MEKEKANIQLTKAQKRRRAYSNWGGYAYIAPWLIGFMILSAWPMIYSLYLSFTDYSMLKAPQWIGYRNYRNIFSTDLNFKKSLGITFKFVFIAVPAKLVFALFIANLLSKDVKGMSMFRTLVYLPSLIGGSVAVSMVWKNIFGLDGYVNTLLGVFGLSPVPWLVSTQWSLYTLILMNVWQFGSSMIIFLAGLKQIPRDLYEAAKVDGAGSVRCFFHITLPQLSPVIFFNLINSLINAFQQFNSAYLVSSGGPAHSTYLYALMLYEKAYISYKMGYASGLAWILLIIIGVFTAINFIVSKYWVHYDD